MSVPWEVWCSTSSGDGKELDGLCRELKAEKVCVGDIRYLRADLTCKECRCLDDSEYWDKCPNEDIGEKSPACMKFQPKDRA